MKISDIIFDSGFYFLLFVVAILFAGLKFLPTDIFAYDWVGIAHNFWLILPEYLFLIMSRFFTSSLILSAILILGVIWAGNNFMRLRNKMHDDLNLAGGADVQGSEAGTKLFINDKWESVVAHINSANESDWKLAILECDIILEDLLEKMGYMQDTISEKLKAVEPSDFTSIESAWEAHKIRNTIAHEGSDFIINEREAKRVIGLYELVFREFSYI